MSQIDPVKELQKAMTDLKSLLADAQNRIGIIEAFLYLRNREDQPEDSSKENLNGPTER